MPAKAAEFADSALEPVEGVPAVPGRPDDLAVTVCDQDLAEDHLCLVATFGVHDAEGKVGILVHDRLSFFDGETDQLGSEVENAQCNLGLSLTGPGFILHGTKPYTT